MAFVPGPRRRTLLAAVVGVTLALVTACASSPRADAPSGGVGTSATAATAPGSTTATTDARPSGERPSPGCAADTPASSTAGTTAPVGEAVAHRSLEVNGATRTYDIAYPARSASTTEVAPSPLVLSFHGFSGDAAKHEASTDIVDKGTAAGNVVVVPDGAGTPRTWQITGTGTDGAFIEALIDHVAATTCIDLARVHLTGLSAGSAFAIAFTCAHQDQVAAIGAVTVEFVLGCKQAVSIIAFHGTSDASVPYQDGGIGLSLPGIAVRGTELNMGDWAKLASCGEPAKTPVSAKVMHWVFNGCTAGIEVELFSIEGGPHWWPRPLDAPDAPAGHLDATDEILAFLSRQHR
jgi:polyhydroxybutyrate depolymerase